MAEYDNAEKHLDPFLMRVRRRLQPAPKLSLQEKFMHVLNNNRAQIDNGRTSMDFMVAELIALVRQEIGEGK